MDLMMNLEELEADALIGMDMDSMCDPLRPSQERG
jgi:hypothetical protein